MKNDLLSFSVMWKKNLYLLGFFVLAGCGAHTSKIDAPNSVADLLAVEIGEMEQWLLIRGENADNPILLWLHGGPGSAQMPIHHAYTKELEKEYIVVHWDQRGAGKSNHSGFQEESMSLDRFILDTHEVTQYLKKRFDREKIYLLGHSWGTLLGIHVVDRYPEDYDAFISVSQVVNARKADTLSYQWLGQEIEQDGSRKEKRKFRELGSPPFDNHDRFVQFAKMIDAFGGGMDAGFVTLAWKALGADEYTFADFKQWFNGANRGSGPMWVETNNTDLFTEIDTLDVPVHFFTGAKDYNTPHELVKEYYRFVEAPEGKALVVFDQSAHTPFIAEQDKFNGEVINVKRINEVKEPWK
ncbi:alpha/beta hydrolase [Fodinibius sp. Rm-B-1B1-1]|uniref:alpha/beta fold hydrolase n=1 Tax=Fodinibius alkaliphilus TaxID=3140241 RepID=UPI00315A938F